MIHYVSINHFGSATTAKKKKSGKLFSLTWGKERIYSVAKGEDIEWEFFEKYQGTVVITSERIIPLLSDGTYPPELLSEINKAMNNILLANPTVTAGICMISILPQALTKSLFFTKEELQYIKQAAPILVSYDPSFAPLTYQSKKAGKLLA